MEDISNEILASVRARVDDRKDAKPLEQLKEQAKRMGGPVDGTPGTGAYETFQDALKRKKLSVIAEVVTASPGRGLFVENPECSDIAYDYESGDADALSLVTEPHWHYGSDEDFIEVRNDVSLPMLKRDYIVEAYQVYEAKYMGADAITIPVSLVDDAQLANLLKICVDIHIDAMLEVRSAEEAERAVRSGSLIIGASTRNIDGSQIGLDEVLSLRSIIPKDCLFVITDVESGEDARNAREAGADAVLIGGPFMKAADSDERQLLVREVSEID